MPKPILFVPGFPASELRDGSGRTVFPPSLSTLVNAAKRRALIQRLLSIPGDLVAGPPIRDVLGIAKQAQSLYDLLGGKFGYDTSELSEDFVAIGWDWRLSIADQRIMDSIAAAIDRLGSGIVAIIHSTGGLVFRAFLEARPDLLPRFEQVMAFGVPWRGTLEALRAITVGESAGFLFAKISAAEGAQIVGHTQAAYDLLPPEQLADLSWATADFMRQLAGSAHAPFPQNFDALPVTNVCGWGIETWTSPDWTSSKDAGDGTVPVSSSSWITGADVRTFFLPIGVYATANIPYPHPRIWDSPPVLQLFEEVLNDAPRTPFLCAAADGDEAIDYDADVDVRLAAISPNGGAVAGCKISVDIDGLKTDVPLNADGRAAFVLKRLGIEHNVANDIYRFTVTFRWSGGTATRAVLIRSV
jgi:lecithin:cholesterol acyltransferase